MDIKKSKELAELVKEYGLTRIEVSEGDSKIVIEKATPPPSAPPAHKEPAASVPNKESMIVSNNEDLVSFNNMIEVKSPIVGVFYSAPSPDKPPFVSVGSKVKRGDILCIVEAMKLLNEIEAEQDGEIVDICIKNGDVAEFGQVLFKMI